MMVSIHAISGFMVGFEIVGGQEVGDDGGFFVVVDLFIVRFVLNFGGNK
jgi:hypothetical protein